MTLMRNGGLLVKWCLSSHSHAICWLIPLIIIYVVYLSNTDYFVLGVWQGTQLLAIDTATATGLLRRAVIGDELSDKENKFFWRTLTDLAPVVPIGVLMLLPVTAVGHAAMLAAIQRYVPALIPSTYGSERLNLLRQLEKMKQTEICDASLDENVEDLAQR